MTTSPKPPSSAAKLTHRLTAVPAPTVDAEPSADLAGELRSRMLPFAASVHAQGRELVTCWMRTRPSGPVYVLVGGVTAGPANSGTDDVALPFPSGATAHRVARDALGKHLGAFTAWVGCELDLDATSNAPEPARPLLEDLFGRLGHIPMALLVAARPAKTTEVQAAFDSLSDLVDHLESRRQGRGSERVRLTRAEAELEYLQRWADAGCWQLEVAAGATSPADAVALAAMVAAGGDVQSTALRLRPAAGPALGTGGWAPRRLVGGDALAALARAPGRELPGVRVTSIPDFDQNVEPKADLRLGHVLDATGSPSTPFGVPLASINRHAFVSGSTGSGKSQTVRAILAQLSAASVPWLAIEPAKAEYARMAAHIDQPLTVIRPGDPGAAPASLNPLEPSSIAVGGGRATFPLQTHLDLVRALFTAAFEAEEPFPQILATALTTSYESLGWNLATGRPLTGADGVAPRWPTLGDLQRQALRAVDDIGYGKEVSDNVRGFVRVRVGSLRQGTPGRFFEGGHPLDLGGVLRSPTVFEIEDLGDDNDKAFFIGTVLIRLFEHLRLQQQHAPAPEELRHVLVIEEAHRLLRRVEEGSPGAHAVTMFANLLAEIRSYGQGVIVAEQIPAKIIPDVVKNSAIKILHRLPSADDREFVGATMNLSEEQSTHAISLPPGQAVAHVDGMDRPVLVAISSIESGRPVRRNGQVNGPQTALRSEACPPSCGAQPCTLEQMERSRRLPLDSSLRLWVDFVTTAHLVGEPIGTPSGPWFQQLQAGPADRVRCAIALAIDDAVDRRHHTIRSTYDPALLKAHLAQILPKQLATGRGLGRPALNWRIGQYRYVDILRALSSPDPGADTAHPHPETAEWVARGVTAPGPSWAEQLDQVRAVAAPATFTDDAAFGGEPFLLETLAAVVLGNRTSGPGTVARAIALLGLEPSWIEGRLETCWTET